MPEKTYDLSRFTKAHQRDFSTALSEIKGGRKYSHWMWYIFPQIYGLGFSATSQFYSIRRLSEAEAFLSDPYLGSNLREICSCLLELETCDAHYIFGSPDDMKLKSSMTLFYAASDGERLFKQVLDKFFGGKADERTLEIIRK